MKAVLVLTIGILLLTGCGNDPGAGSEKTVQEIKNESGFRNSDIVRNPVSAGAPTDTTQIAKIEFAEVNFNFGEVAEGETVTHVFRFTNSGQQPLVIQDARSTCGCTVPDWSREPIPPGGGGEISVKFDTKNKREMQTKPITITANTYPSVSRIFLTGYVRPAEEAKPSGK